MGDQQGQATAPAARHLLSWSILTLTWLIRRSILARTSMNTLAASGMPPTRYRTDQVAWGTGGGLEYWNETILREVLQKAAAQTGNRTDDEQKIGDYWAACMDEEVVEAIPATRSLEAGFELHRSHEEQVGSCRPGGAYSPGGSGRVAG